MKILSFVVVIILALSANASLRSDSPNTVIANSFYVLIDANKNVTAESSTGTAMTGYGFDASFDDIDRVTQWDRDNATDSQTWTLDLIGNWGNTTGSLAGNSFNETRTHNGVHELTAMGSNSVTYDDKGNMTVDANANTLTWDIDNHLESFGNIDFTYDALGRRLEKKTATTDTLYISNGQRVIEEYEDSGSGYALARSYVHGSYIDDIVAKIEAVNTPTVLYYHSDRQFNVRGLSNSTGNIIELYAYSVYGQQTTMTSTGGILAGSSNNNSYCFTGRYLDDETGLWYFRARYFSDEMGRFINRDPLGYVDGMSLYGAYFAEGFNLDPSGTVDIRGDWTLPNGKPLPKGTSNCLGGASTNEEDRFRYPDSKKDPKKNFIEAMADDKWICKEIKNVKDCKCKCEQEKLLITQYKKTSKKNPWTDPTFPHDPYKSHINDIHAIRADKGCSNKWKQIPHTEFNKQKFNDKIQWNLFKGTSLLCCCRDK